MKISTKCNYGSTNNKTEFNRRGGEQENEKSKVEKLK